MTDYLGIGMGVSLALLGYVGCYYSARVAKLFNGDVMGRLFRLMVAAYLFVGVLTTLDAILLLVNFHVLSEVLGVTTLVSLGVLLAGMIQLLRWNESSLVVPSPLSAITELTEP